MKRQTDELVKRVALKFLGDDPYISQQFLSDLVVPEPPYPAPIPIYEIASHLREFSHFFYDIITSLVAAYLFYLYQKHEAKKSQEEAETKFREILKEHENQIAEHHRKNEELHSKFKRVNLKKIYIRVKPDMKTKWELRLKVYSDKANLLLNPEDATKEIIRILKELTNDKLNQ